MILLWACVQPDSDSGPWPDHGAIAAGITAPLLGDPVPFATAEQLDTFARGKTVAEHRFTLAEGLGPAFNVVSCASCHERPVTGGAAGLYRNFYLGGYRNEDGAFFFAPSAGNPSGVVRMYAYDPSLPDRPPVDAATTIVAQRNPIPAFGVGLLAELDDEEIARRADPEDADGDGISGRPNYDTGFVGRFGMKSQTVSIEGFVRGPIFNHAGITSDPLTEAEKAALPVDSSSAAQGAMRELALQLSRSAQAAAPAAPTVDDDGVADPELAPADLFDLVSFVMLLAPPTFDSPTAASTHGQQVFDQLGCGGCHTPRLDGPRGPLPVYSDLLLHNMGDDLADGLEQGEALGDEFRTAPLWGVTAEGPYLHDGRATTLRDAILLHGGEGEAARDAFAEADAEDTADLLTFLASLGGGAQASAGLLPPDSKTPEAGTLGGPRVDLDPADLPAWEAGRRLFDQDFGTADGVGAPRFNGDSCRACHFAPTLGGAGPRDVNVMRHGILGSGGFVVPAVGTVLHKETTLLSSLNAPQSEADIFEARQTPHLYGLGLIDTIADAAILAQEDPDDLDHDGISGRASWVDGGRLGRFGWKAQVPSIAEFVRDAFATELGLTLPWEVGLLFGELEDNDAVADPELSLDDAAAIVSFLRGLAPPPRTATDADGEATFLSIGCAACHTPSLPGPTGDVPLYSDLLLHAVLPAGSLGIEDASAGMEELRTPPLWGLGDSEPYLHDGSADTIEAAILAHDGEAVAARDAYAALDADRRTHLLTMLEGL